jgi:hypothetical protein
MPYAVALLNLLAAFTGGTPGQAFGDRPSSRPCPEIASGRVLRTLPTSAQSVPSIVADYRASAGIDLDMERADRAAGRQLTMPVGVISQDWGSRLGFDPIAIWGAWAPDLTYEPTNAGHFMAEEDPARVTSFVQLLLAR